MSGGAVVSGGGFVTAGGHGRLGEGRPLLFPPGAPLLPRKGEIFAVPPARYGRFDDYTRLGCAAVALALRDAGLEGGAAAMNAGVVCASGRECLATDLAFQASTLAEDGRLASPNLFTYTLPTIVLGECAVAFGLTGPTFCTGEDGRMGMTALLAALRLLEGGEAGAMLAGWIESVPAAGADSPLGALFVVVEPAPRPGARVFWKLRRQGDAVLLENGARLRSLPRLFAARE
ncbi:MAG: beta-ketoacyl synthase [Planctomycetes bacterium]|nr:beta-ketoacyl synthase [Planctomycetota bacterium]